MTCIYDVNGECGLLMAKQCEGCAWRMAEGAIVCANRASPRQHVDNACPACDFWQAKEVTLGE